MELRPHLAPHAAVRRPTAALPSAETDRLLAAAVALEGCHGLDTLLHQLQPVHYYLERWDIPLCSLPSL
jgi:hypothetical protein